MEGRHRIRIDESTAGIYEDMKNLKTEANRNDPFSEIKALLEQAFIKSKCLDLESLCIRAGSNCFTVESRLSILSDDGALDDCCSIAVAVGLKHFRLPTAIVRGDSVTLDNSVTKRLSIYHLPFLVSFATFPQDVLHSINCNLGNRSVNKISTNVSSWNVSNSIGDLVLDPTKIESKLSSGTITLAINKHKELCGMKTTGGICLVMFDIQRVYKLALDLVRGVISPALEKALDPETYVDKFNFDVVEPDYEELQENQSSQMDDIISQARNMQQTMEEEVQDEEEGEEGNNFEINEQGRQAAGFTDLKGQEFNPDDWGVDDLISSVRADMES